MAPELTRAIRAVVFDLDGTLVDSRADIAAAANHMLHRAGLEAQTVQQICAAVGDGARALVERVVATSPGQPGLRARSRVDELLDIFLSYYTEHATDETTLMPGAAHALDALAHLPLAVLTNKPAVTAQAVLTDLDLLGHFEVIVAGGDTPERKPSPEPLRHLGRMLGVPPRGMVVVGDGPQDVECGRAAGARTVGVRGGILPIEKLERSRPDHLIDSLGDLPELVASWSGD